MSKDIIMVSNNIGKIKEVKAILSPLGYNVLSLKDVNIDVDVKETGATFEENALIKARFLKDKFDRIIADDSGVEFFGLDNKPGVYSARFLGKDLDDKIKNQKIIEMLEGKDKGARFVSVIAYIDHGQEMVFRGEVLGEVPLVISGSSGFGYDPIFKPKGYNQTFGEMDEDLKNQISHRALSLKKLENWLKNAKV